MLHFTLHVWKGEEKALFVSSSFDMHIAAIANHRQSLPIRQDCRSTPLHRSQRSVRKDRRYDLPTEHTPIANRRRGFETGAPEMTKTIEEANNALVLETADHRSLEA